MEYNHYGVVMCVYKVFILQNMKHTSDFKTETVLINPVWVEITVLKCVLKHGKQQCKVLYMHGLPF